MAIIFVNLNEYCAFGNGRIHEIYMYIHKWITNTTNVVRLNFRSANLGLNCNTKLNFNKKQYSMFKFSLKDRCNFMCRMIL